MRPSLAASYTHVRETPSCAASALGLIRTGLSRSIWPQSISRARPVPSKQIALPLLIYGTGVGFAISQLTNATLLGVPFSRIGQAAGVSSTARQVGSAVGVGVLSAVFAAAIGLSLPHHLEQSAPGLSSVERAAITQEVKASPATAPSIVARVPSADRAQVQSAITSSLSVGTRLAALAAAIPIALAWGLSRRLPKTRPGPIPGAQESSAPEEQASIGVQA